MLRSWRAESGQAGMDHGGPARQVSGARFRERIQRHVAGDARMGSGQGDGLGGHDLRLPCGKAYAYLDPVPGYRVFIRVGGRGGTALSNSFMGGRRAEVVGVLNQKWKRAAEHSLMKWGPCSWAASKLPWGFEAVQRGAEHLLHTTVANARRLHDRRRVRARHQRCVSELLPQHRTQHVRRTRL